MTAPTIKDKYHCSCGKRVWVVDLRSKKQFCSERCKELAAFIKKSKQSQK